MTVVTRPFASLAKAVAASESVMDPCLVTIPHPIGMLPVPDVYHKAENAFPEIIKMATAWQPSDDPVVSKTGHPARIFKFRGTVEDVNRHFFSEGWSMGLPIVPPTCDGVAELARFCDRKSADVIGRVPPRMGVLTVELCAVYAAMAGCRPEFMPVLIAALEGFLCPEANWLGTLSTTGTTQFIVIVNGPVTQRVGIGFEQGAAGKGHHPNASIGYALNLIAYAVGGSKPPAIDRSTLASPSDYVCWVFGENEGALPKGWEPLHVDRGFKRSDSVVTVMASYPPVENIDHWSTSVGEWMKWWSCIVSPMHNMGGPCSPAVMDLNPIVALGPEHAELVSSAGWSKEDLRRSFWDRTRIPASAWPSGCTEHERLEARFGPIAPDAMVPITHTPEQIMIVLAGGEGKHSHYFAPFPGAQPVSRLVGDADS